MKYVVPQGIDNEDKIFGPITTRQFMICLVGGGTMYALYAALPLVPAIIGMVIVGGLAGAFAFIRINDQPFHFFVLNMVQTFKRPGTRVWSKELDEGELQNALKELPPPPPAAEPKARIASSRLTELALVVNTGGVYDPDSEK